MAEKESTKKATEKRSVTYNIVKDNGKIIQRTDIDPAMMKRYKAKGWKVEEV